MALGQDFILDLMKFHEKGILAECRSVLDIGAQQLSYSFVNAREDLEKLYAALGIENGYYPEPIKETEIVHGRTMHLNEDAPFARDFYEALGMDYAAVEIDGHANSIPLDLNMDSVPRGRVGAFDLVTNFGTTEHVCNQLNAFKVIHDFTRFNGYMFHDLPMGGYFNHGLFNYNPKFFWMLCRANGYQVMFMKVLPAKAPYPMPENITDFIAQYDQSVEVTSDFRVDDVAIKILLKKATDIPFVAPFDSTDDFLKETPGVRKRYGKIFDHGGKRWRFPWRRSG